MIVHRFMSSLEYQRLMRGDQLRNFDTHIACATDSIGFCFFVEDPFDAIHWLSGIVDCDYCVTMDIPDKMLIKSFATYLNPSTEGRMRKKEYCLTNYCKDDVRIVKVYSEEFRKYSYLTRLMRYFI